MFFLLKLLKLGEIDDVKFLARKSGGVNFWTNSRSGGLSGWGGLRGVLFGGGPKKNLLGKKEILGGEEQKEGSQPKTRREEEEDHAVETVAAAGRQFDNQVSNMFYFLICLSWFPDELGCHTVDTR